MIEQRDMLSSYQLVEATPGLTYRVLDYWIRCGVIPGRQDGSGNQRIVALLNELAMFMRGLGNVGASTDALRQVAEWARIHPTATTLAIRGDLDIVGGDLEIVDADSESFSTGTWLVLCTEPVTWKETVDG